MNLSHLLPSPATESGPSASPAPTPTDLYLLAMSALFHPPAAPAASAATRNPVPRKAAARPRPPRDCTRR